MRLAAAGLLLAAMALLFAAANTPVNDGFGEMVLVPAGPFKMGDNFNEGDPRERPVHTVEVSAFYIGKYEITNGQFRKFRDDDAVDDRRCHDRRRAGGQWHHEHEWAQ